LDKGIATNAQSTTLLWLPGFGPDENPLALSAPEDSSKPSVVSPIVFTADAHSWATARISRALFSDLKGEVTKFEANVKAIELLRKLEMTDGIPASQERDVLNRYTGWGGIPGAFNVKQSEPAWVRRAEMLQGMLGEAEYNSARDSTPNAHYTSINVIEAMWAMVQRMGFSGGRVLEPAAGVGYFLGGMPTEIAERSEITAIELDNVSARILKALYNPYGVNVIESAFERTRLPEGFFDLAIGNIPFGNYKVPEMRNVTYQNFLIHDYFFAKALDLVRPGGLVVFITSSGTFDKNDESVRQYLASKSDLVTAVRLPEVTFKAIANTRVTTDIVVLRKRDKLSSGKKPWMDIVQIHNDSPLYGEEVRSYYPDWRMRANEYFVKHHPELVIGKLKLIDNGYEKSVGCFFEGDLDKELAARVSMIEKDVYSDRLRSEKSSSRPPVTLIPTDDRIGFRVIEDQIWESDGSRLTLVEVGGTKAARIRGLIEIRDTVRALAEAQPVTEDDSALVPLRERLSSVYDAFVKKHGYIHDKANRTVFRQDADWPLLLSLESVDEEEGIVTKTDIFTRRTVGVTKRLVRASSAEEALMATLAETGAIDAIRLGDLLGKPSNAVLRELRERGAVFIDPESGRWETSDAYLSGNVRKKLTVAEASGEKYRDNVTALKAVIPPDLAPYEIGARIGSTWIPTSDYEAFLRETFEDDEALLVAFNSVAGTGSVASSWRVNRCVAATQTFGTSRIGAIELFEQALNQQVPTIYDYDPLRSDKRIVNRDETLAAREKQQELKDHFVKWLWADDARAQRLVRIYNDEFNNLVDRKYDGSHLVLPGFSDCVVLANHQKNAIWRMVVSGRNTLLAHPVGAGKTLEMICASMEMRRLGKARKPCHVVPNHILEQYTAEFLRAYPSAKVLMATKEDFVSDSRRELLSRIATGDWDAVILTLTMFERIALSDEQMKRFISDEILTIQAELNQYKREDRSNKIVKELARAKKQWEARLTKLSRKDKKDDVLTFDDLGIDQLFMDEAHFFKNLYRHSKMNRIAGLPNSNSERAFDLFVKIRYLMQKREDGAGVVFATATPIANSMAEAWVMQRYLQPQTLMAYMIDSFDTWAGSFGEAVTALEVAPDGSGYRMNTRFARFINLPELLAIFRQVADIRTKESLNLPTPKVRRETVTAKASVALKKYVKVLVERAENIRNGYVDSHEDNMLSVTNDGRKAALDIRLVDPESEEEPGSKVELCAQNIHRIWSSNSERRATQLVFCDLSTPQADGRFNVYGELKNKLIELGVHAAEVAFIHDYDTDAAKAKLFKDVREGRIRVLLGSTWKMGIGTNVQTRLVALHHLDAPWRPADIEQREGRIERQGNLNEEVFIFRYVTEGSFDTYLWQTLETKAKFIAQVMHGDTGIRSAEEIELAALSYAEVKALASGNPMVLEKAGVDAEIAKLAVLKSHWDQQQWANRQEIASLPTRISGLERQIEAYKADIAARTDVSGTNFSIMVNGETFTDRKQAGSALLKSIKSIHLNETRSIGAFGGFELLVRTLNRHTDGKFFVLRGKLEHDTPTVNTLEGAVTQLESKLISLDKDLDTSRRQLEMAVNRLNDLKYEVTRTFGQMDRLNWLRNRQREIEEELDISKGDAYATEDDDIPEAA